MWRVQVSHSIQEIGLKRWCEIADLKFPFSSYHYLAALETSDCLGSRTGWYPRLVTVWRQDELAGAVILYLKTNSYGEYIFDFAWADAFERSGLAYFPKLTSSIPFTPATGPKLLTRPGPHASEAEVRLLRAVDGLAAELKVSSLHALFLPQSQVRAYEAAGYFPRHSFQFHWENLDYTSFKAFTASLRSKRRKEILRERAQVTEAQVKILRLTGDELQAEHADLFYQFYLSTIDKRNSHDYLTREFFKAVFIQMRAQILLVLALDQAERPVAGALNYFSDDTLYGRNWGCLAEYKSLHFELCYYQGIEFAIERGLKRFEAGAQGEHKLQRGFLPTLTYSAHKVYHPQLGQAIREHVAYEKLEIAKALQIYGEHSPFASVPP